jgi:hypothetical protein
MNKMKVDFFINNPVATLRCPKCHHRTTFRIYRTEEISSGGYRIILKCSYRYNRGFRIIECNNTILMVFIIN